MDLEESCSFSNSDSSYHERYEGFLYGSITPHVDSIPPSQTLHTTSTREVGVEDARLSWSESTRKSEDTVGKLEPDSIADWRWRKKKKMGELGNN